MVCPSCLYLTTDYFSIAAHTSLMVSKPAYRSFEPEAVAAQVTQYTGWVRPIATYIQCI